MPTIRLMQGAVKSCLSVHEEALYSRLCRHVIPAGAVAAAAGAVSPNMPAALPAPKLRVGPGVAAGWEVPAALLLAAKGMEKLKEGPEDAAGAALSPAWRACSCDSDCISLAELTSILILADALYPQQLVGVMHEYACTSCPSVTQYGPATCLILRLDLPHVTRLLQARASRHRNLVQSDSPKEGALLATGAEDAAGAAAVGVEAGAPELWPPKLKLRPPGVGAGEGVEAAAAEEAWAAGGVSEGAENPPKPAKLPAAGVVDATGADMAIGVGTAAAIAQ